MNELRLDPHEIRKLAVSACVDPRTLKAFLVGRPIRSTVRARIVQAMAEAGLQVPAASA